MRRTLAATLLALSLLTVSANAAPRREDGAGGGFFSRIRTVIHRIVQHITDGGDSLLPPK